MVKEIFSKIIDSIAEKVLNDEFEVDESRFVEIKRENNGKKIAFVDGGQAELLKAVNFSLQFIRVSALIFENNKKVGKMVEEFFVLIYDDNEEYKTEIFPLKGEAIGEISMNSMDASIRDGQEKASISKIGGIVRRFAELKLAKKVIEQADKVGKSQHSSSKAETIIVLDGSLKCMVKGEDERMQELFEKADGVVVAALAKTSKIMKGVSKLIDKEGEWCYNIKDGVSIVKLNKNSNHVFEFNIKQKEKAMDVLGELAANSNDAVFPGYPYGLIQADKIARVSNQERDYLITVFKANAGRKWKKLKANVDVLNAHEILDNI